MMEEFVQEFKRVARGSGYEGRPLMEEFKRGIIGGRVGGKKKDCEGRRNREKGLRNRSRNRYCHDY